MADPKSPPWDPKKGPVPSDPRPPATEPRLPNPDLPRAKPKPEARRPGPEVSTEGPQSTLFMGGPARPRKSESWILLVDSKKAYIAATAGPGKGRQWNIAGDKVTLGREPPADIRVDDAACSRRHAQVYRKQGRWYLRDLDSTNGTYLDGPLRGTERILWDGDVFRIGDWEFTFSDPDSVRK